MLSFERTPMTISAILISPFESDHHVMRQVFTHSNWSLHCVGNCEEALRLISDHSIPVVICSTDMQADWRTILHATSAEPNPPRVIVFSRLADERLWADVMHNGAYTLLDSPFDVRDIVTSVSLAWHSWYHECRQKKAAAAAPVTRELAAVAS